MMGGIRGMQASVLCIPSAADHAAAFSCDLPRQARRISGASVSTLRNQPLCCLADASSSAAHHPPPVSGSDREWMLLMLLPRVTGSFFVGVNDVTCSVGSHSPPPPPPRSGPGRARNVPRSTRRANMVRSRYRKISLLMRAHGCLLTHIERRIKWELNIASTLMQIPPSIQLCRAGIPSARGPPACARSQLPAAGCDRPWLTLLELSIFCCEAGLLAPDPHELFLKLCIRGTRRVQMLKHAHGVLKHRG